MSDVHVGVVLDIAGQSWHGKTTAGNLINALIDRNCVSMNEYQSKTNKIQSPCSK